MRMTIDPNMIPLALATLALMVPHLYDGSLFTRERCGRDGLTERRESVCDTQGRRFRTLGTRLVVASSL
jgi:hypothetical protein